MLRINFLTTVLSSKKISLMLLVACFSSSMLRSHFRQETVILGYELSKLKTEEAQLLRKNSDIVMELAKITDVNHLQMILSVSSDVRPSSRNLAKN